MKRSPIYEKYLQNKMKIYSVWVRGGVANFSGRSSQSRLKNIVLGVQRAEPRFLRKFLEKLWKNLLEYSFQITNSMLTFLHFSSRFLFFLCSLGVSKRGGGSPFPLATSKSSNLILFEPNISRTQHTFVKIRLCLEI